MSSYFISRLLTLILTLWFSSLIIFFIIEILPGDPALIMLGTGAEEATILALQKELGSNLPPITRYLRWIDGMLNGDFGKSYVYDQSVKELILERFRITFPLSIISVLIIIFVSIPLGVFLASQYDTYLDKFFLILTQLALAIPNFWIAILFILFFSVYLGWFNAGGFIDWDHNWLHSFKSLLLPAFSLAIPQTAILVKVTRSSVLENLNSDFIRTARAKGLSINAALWNHSLRNSLTPVITILGLQFSFLLSGTIIIENVFYLPGLGRLLFQAINLRDLILIKNLILLFTAIFIIINFMIDLIQVLIDPRINFENY